MGRRALALTVAFAAILASQVARDDAGAVRGVFERPTGTTLVFDNGIDGVLAVDLDRRVATRRSVHGQHGGDPPYRLGFVNDSFVVGWGEITVASLDGSRGRSLGKATIWLPAAEPRSVWLVDYPGGSLGAGRASYRHVDLSGRTLTYALAPEEPGVRAVAGVTGGLLHETPTGIGVFDPDEGRWSYRSNARSGGFFFDRAGARVAWCEGLCTRLHITDLVRRTDVTVRPPRGTQAFWRAAISPEGARVAVASGHLGPTSDSSRATIAIVDATTGRISSVTRAVVPDHPYLTWHGDHVFATANSYGLEETTIAAFSPDGSWRQVVVLPFGGALRPVALDRRTAAAIVLAPETDAASCEGPGTGEGAGAPPCSFAF